MLNPPQQSVRGWIANPLQQRVRGWIANPPQRMVRAFGPDLKCGRDRWHEGDPRFGRICNPARDRCGDKAAFRFSLAVEQLASPQKLLELLGGNRAADEVALHFVTTDDLEKRQLVEDFIAFGCHSQLHAMRHSDDGPDYRGVILVKSKVADE